MKVSFYAILGSFCLLMVSVVLKIIGQLPSWSTVVFLGFLFLGLYKITGAVSGGSRGVSFDSLWGFFFLFSSLAFLGQEFNIWHFWNIKNSLVLTGFFVALGLFTSSFFFPNPFLKVVVFVPAVFLVFLSGVAFLTFYNYLRQAFFVPLWQVNVLVVLSAFVWMIGQNFRNQKRKDSLKHSI